MTRPIQFPADMRPYRYDLKWVMAQNTRLLGKLSRRVALLIAVYSLIVVLVELGWRSLLDLSVVGWMTAAVVAGTAFFALLVFCINWRRLKADKLMYMEQLFGFDENALYCQTAIMETWCAWEYFSSWEELPASFVLRISRGGWILPKALWTEEEQALLRSYLLRHVRSCRVWLPDFAKRTDIRSERESD